MNKSTELFRCPKCDGFHFNISQGGTLVCTSVLHNNRVMGCGWEGRHDATKPEGPKIPPGWELTESDADDFCIGGYYWAIDFNGERWKPCGKLGYRGKFTFIRQTIDIDLPTQPEELMAWAMDSNGRWFGYLTKELDILQHGWEPESQDIWSRALLKSESPKYSGDWQDSLLVRPESI